MTLSTDTAVDQKEPITLQRMRSVKRVALWPFRKTLMPWAVRRPPSRAKRAVLHRVVMPQLHAQGFDFEKRIDDRTVFLGNTRDLGPLLIYLFGTYEPTITRFVRGRLRPGDTFVDIGANVGWFSVLGGHLVGPSGSVVSIEPSPALSAKLEQNLVANGLTNVKIIRAAAGERQGRVDLVPGPEENTGWTWVRPGSEIPLDTAPNLVGLDVWRSARLIKIDVEGSEFDIIRGAASLLGQLSPSAEIVIEVSTDATFGPRSVTSTGSQEEAVAALFGCLAAAGFHPYRMTDPYALSDYFGDHGPQVLERLHAVPDHGGDFVFSRVDAASLPL